MVEAAAVAAVWDLAPAAGVVEAEPAAAGPRVGVAERAVRGASGRLESQAPRPAAGLVRVAPAAVEAPESAAAGDPAVAGLAEAALELTEALPRVVDRAGLDLAEVEPAVAGPVAQAAGLAMEAPEPAAVVDPEAGRAVGESAVVSARPVSPESGWRQQRC